MDDQLINLLIDRNNYNHWKPWWTLL